MDIYQELKVQKIINAAGTYSVVGASRMTNETLQALCDASRWNVEIEKLQAAVHLRIAEMTRNESAYLCNSCSTAIYLAVAACISKHYGRPFGRISRDEIHQCEVVAMLGQRLPYHQIIEQVGAKIRYAGHPDMRTAFSSDELRPAINENTVCCFYVPRVQNGYYTEDSMNLQDFIHTAQACGMPVLVDAAAQLPPKSNLWHFTEMGADIVCFSGGKDLSGPQASGLMLGRKSYLDIVAQIGFPRQGYGRTMKIGREEIIALYCAIKQYMEIDEEERLRICERDIRNLIDCLEKSAHFRAERTWPNEAGQPLPRAFVTILDENIPAERLRSLLMRDEPGIFCYPENRHGVFINPMCLYEGEMDTIIQRLLRIDREL